VASPTATHHKVVRKMSVASLLGKIGLLIVVAAIFFGAWHYHTRIAPGKAVTAFLRTAKKQDWATMKNHVTKASAKMLPGKGDEGSGSLPAALYFPDDSKFIVKGMHASFSRGTVKVEGTCRFEGAERSWVADWPVVRQGLSWKIDLKATAPSEENSGGS